MNTSSLHTPTSNRLLRIAVATLLPLAVLAAGMPGTAGAADKNATLKPESCKSPEYPQVSARLEESGTTVLSMLISVDGSVLESKVQTSSGFDRLDQAAKSALSRCKFNPASTNGKPEQTWSPVSYKWKL